MHKNVFKLISSYTRWIIANYQAIVKINDAMPALRLISEERDKKTGEMRFKIQIAGKNIFPVLSLKDLKNPKTIFNFSKNDQDIIRSYLFDGRQRIFKRITARTYDIKTKKFAYTIESFDNESKIKRCITIDNLTLLSNDINHFDMEDALLIGLELK